MGHEEVVVEQERDWRQENELQRRVSEKEIPVREDALSQQRRHVEVDRTVGKPGDCVDSFKGQKAETDDGQGETGIEIKVKGMLHLSKVNENTR